MLSIRALLVIVMCTTASGFLLAVASIALPSVGFVIDARVENLYTRLSTVYNDMVNVEITNMDAANIATNRATQIRFIYDSVAQRAGYSGFIDFLGDQNKIIEQKNGSFGVIAEVEEDMELNDQLLVASAVGSSIILVNEAAGSYLAKSLKINTQLKALNSPIRGLLKAWSYGMQGQRWLRAKIFTESISEADAEIQRERMSSLAERATDGAINNIDSVDGVDPALNAKIKKNRISMKKVMKKLEVVAEVFDRVVEIFSFIADIVVIVKGSDAINQIKDELKVAVPLRFALKRFQYQLEIYDALEIDLATAYNTWISLQNAVDAGDGCYAGVDTELALQSDMLITRFLDQMENLTDQVVYDRLQNEDDLRGHDTSDDPSLDDILQYLLNEELDIGGDEVDEDDDTNIFDDNPSGIVEPGYINGTNVRYVEFANGQGAMWKLSGPFWSYQESTDGDNVALRPVRHRLEEVNISSGKVELKLLKTEAVEVDVQTEMELLINEGVGSLNWPGRPSLQIDPSTPSNVIPANGWTTYFVAADFSAGDLAPGFPEVIEECRRSSGWQAKRVGTSNQVGDLMEIFRSKDLIKGSNVDTIFDPPEIYGNSFEIDLVSNTMTLVRGNARSAPIDLLSMIPRMIID